MGVFTVGEVARLSGLSIRALRHYDEIGLLKPMTVGENGYRYYGPDELLRLQQIMFHRELGFSLNAIGQILDTPDFDRAAALRAHRVRLAAEARRYRTLLKTLDATLAALEGDGKMSEKAMYRGFDPQKQAQYEAWVVDRYGPEVQWSIDAVKQAHKTWTQADFDRSEAEVAEIEAGLARAMGEGAPVDSDQVQALVRRLHAWVGRSWVAPPGRVAFANLAELYDQHPDFRAHYEDRAKGLTDYLVAAMTLFAETELE